jgi:hypothetical protein
MLPASIQFDKPSVVLLHHLPVKRRRLLERGKRTRHRRGPVNRAVVKVRVAAVQHPAVAGVDRNARVAASVTRQRDQRDARRHLSELLGRGEASPLLTVRCVFDDGGPVRPLHRAEADLLAHRRGSQCAERLRSGDVYLRLGEIGDAADVVGVEMGDDDVPHVVTSKAKLLNLIDGGLPVIEHRTDESPRRSQPARGIGAVLDPNPESISTRPLSDSTRSTWHTIVPHPSGYKVPQLRW